MTAIEHAIKEAQSAGYEIDYPFAGSDVRDYARRITLRNIAFNDPLFWQALGKARKWDETWLKNWHHFIDHLAFGGDAESFFSSLN
jgi:hypothetical protein